MSVCLWSGYGFTISLAGKRRQPKNGIDPAVLGHLGFVRTIIPSVLDTTYWFLSNERGSMCKDFKAKLMSAVVTIIWRFLTASVNYIDEI